MILSFSPSYKHKVVVFRTVSLTKLAVTNQLTGLYNRHKIEIEIEQERRSVRYKTHLLVIMFDIDWFKKINDTYGHQAGDSVLKKISLVLKKLGVKILKL